MRLVIYAEIPEQLSESTMYSLAQLPVTALSEASPSAYEHQSILHCPLGSRAPNSIFIHLHLDGGEKLRAAN